MTYVHVVKHTPTTWPEPRRVHIDMACNSPAHATRKQSDPGLRYFEIIPKALHPGMARGFPHGHTTSFPRIPPLVKRLRAAAAVPPEMTVPVCAGSSSPPSLWRNRGRHGCPRVHWGSRAGSRARTSISSTSHRGRTRTDRFDDTRLRWAWRLINCVLDSAQARNGLYSQSRNGHLRLRSHRTILHLLGGHGLPAS